MVSNEAMDFVVDKVIFLLELFRRDQETFKYLTHLYPESTALWN